MINELKYKKLKKILKSEFDGRRIGVHIEGIIDTSITLDGIRIIINKNKMILADENNVFELEFLMVKKIIFDPKWHIQIVFDEFKVTIEV